MTTTDWRELCERLTELLELCQPPRRWEIAQPDLIATARAALAQPEPEAVGPSDEELLACMIEAARSVPDGQAIGIADWDQEAIAAARAVLAHFGGRPAPAPAGEVAELVAWLGVVSEQFRLAELDPEADQTDRAADLLQRQAAPVPVAVSERLPEPSVKVLAHYFNVLGKGRTICAIWVPAKTRSDSYGDDDFTEYDEESDTFYWPEGWYETIENWDDLGYVKVDEGEVIYWQPLPKWPAHALPLPSGEVES